MKELKRVYGNFQLLKKNGDNSITKVTYSSLDKYSKSPYLQKITIQSNRKQTHRENTPSNRGLNSPTNLNSELKNESEEKPKHINHIQLPKLTTPFKFREGEVTNYFKTELQSLENPLIKNKASIGTHSATLEVNSKTNKLQPLQKAAKLNYVVKTKAGTNGKQAKTNQDIAIADPKLPFGLKMFGVCDGHGVNGHLVSAFIKAHLIKNLNSSLKKFTNAPLIADLKIEITAVFAKTNQQLLDCDINTELSGSTVVVIFIYNNKIISFNVGDSRAILLRQSATEKEGSKEEESEKSQNSFIDFKFNNRMVRHQWRTIPLTSDHKPDRPDEKQRILDFGGRIFSQRNERGDQLGPLRVWMKDLAMPGLAMTRSFGDKAGIKAGTMGEPEVMQFDLTNEDKFIVVASDGIWQYLQNEEVMTLLIPFYRGDVETAAERLVKVSSQIWQKVSFSRDDITVIIVSLNTPHNNK